MMKIYSAYVRDYAHATSVLQVISVRFFCRKQFLFLKTHMRRWRFARFIEQREDMSRCEGLKLPALLITPIQRLPRYRLLFEQLKEHCLTYEHFSEKHKMQLNGSVIVCCAERRRNHYRNLSRTFLTSLAHRHYLRHAI